MNKSNKKDNIETINKWNYNKLRKMKKKLLILWIMHSKDKVNMEKIHWKKIFKILMLTNMTYNSMLIPYFKGLQPSLMKETQKECF